MQLSVVVPQIVPVLTCTCDNLCLRLFYCLCMGLTVVGCVSLSITCQTGPSVSGEIDREVKVTVVDPSHTTVNFNIRGKASSGHVSFSYKVCLKVSE